MLLTPESFRKLNSLTQYPKINTFHKRGDDGLLIEDVRAYPAGSLLYLTEKIDGENVRVVFLPTGEFLIGSRTEWLTMSGDRVYNEKGGMVDTLWAVSRRMAHSTPFYFSSNRVVSFFFEVYGSKLTPQWRQYGDGTPGFRLFDIAAYDLDQLDWDIEDIARWRDEQDDEGVWVSEANLATLATTFQLPMTPRLALIDAEDLPTSIEGMRLFLEQYERTEAATTPDHVGNSEGLVVSTYSRMRRYMTKIKFKDYDRALSKRVAAQKAAEKAARKAAAMAGR